MGKNAFKVFVKSTGEIIYVKKAVSTAGSIFYYDAEDADVRYLPEEIESVDSIRLKIATEIYTRGLVNTDGTFAVFGCCESFRRADKLIEAMVKTRNKEEETGDDI